MKTTTKGLLSLSVAAVLAAPTALWATNGYFMPGVGAKSLGMGGVGIAFAQDSLSAAANPAGLVDVGTRIDLGVGLFNPERSVTMQGDGRAPDFPYDPGYTCSSSNKCVSKYKSDNHLFPIPTAGMSYSLGNGMAVGIAAVAAGGMNTTFKKNFYAYDEQGLGGAGYNSKIGVDLMQLSVPVTFAMEVLPKQNVGVSAIYYRQRFAARGLQSFQVFDISAYPDDMTNKGYDYSNGFGWRLGWTGKFLNDGLTLGAVYTPRTHMGNFRKYRGLFAAQGNFDIPENYGLGLAFKVTDQLTAAFDVVRILYSNVPSVGNRGPSPTAYFGAPNAFPNTIPSGTSCTSSNDPNCLGRDAGMGFGWKDSTVFKLGFSYEYDKDLTVRAGVNFSRSPIPGDQLAFNTLAPAVVERHLHAGFTYKTDDDGEWTFSLLHAFSRTQKGLYTFGYTELQMSQTQLDIAYAWKF